MKQAAISAYIQVISMYQEHSDIAKKFMSSGDIMRCLLSLISTDRD